METAIVSRAEPKPKTAATGMQRMGDYELLELLGEGGQGKVYRARQRSLNRVVALKLLRGGALAGGTDAARFRAEAAAAALLRHPGIVGIYEVGEHEGQLFYSMEHVEGTDLATLAKQEQLSPKWVAHCVARVAEAVQAAHERGVLHRDLKPSNVLLDAEDAPRITDFGLARRLDEAGNLTLSHQALGTPGYAAPELASGPGRKAVPATDVYGLGGILYDLLTGRPPFVGDSASEVLRQVMEKEPIAPRALRPGIPRDLETICLKCLQKEPHRRYRTAQAVADDLSRLLNGEPIQARPVSPPERIWRWCKRRPAVSALVVGLAICLLALALGSTVAAYRINAARLEEQRQHEMADQALADAYLAQARAQRVSGEPGQRFGTLEAVTKAVELGPLTPQRKIELRKEAIAAFALVDLRHIWTKQLKFGEEFACFDHSLERYAVAGTNGVISVRHIPDDHEVAQLIKPPDNLYWRPFEFSPDGRWLAVNSLRKSRVCLWNLQTGEATLELEGTAAGFSADSHKLVVNDPAIASLLLQDLVDTNHTRQITSGTLYYHVVVDHEGKKLAALSAGEKGTRSQATIFDIATGSELNRITGEEDEELWCSWQPGGRYLAFTSESLHGIIRFYDVHSGELVKQLNGHPHFVPGMAFNLEGNLLASSSWDDTTRLWSFPAGRELLRFYGSGWPAFALDGRKFGLCSWEQSTLYLFELAPPPPEARRFEMTEKPQESCEAIAFNSTGEVLAHTGGGRNIIVRDAATLEPIAFLTNNAKLYVTRDPNTPGFLVGGDGRCLRFPIERQSATGGFRVGEIGPWGPTNVFGPTVLTIDGRFMAGVDDKADIYVVDLTGRTAQRCVGRHKRTSFLAISPDARWVATCAWNDNHVRIWNVEKQCLERDLATEGMASLIFSPDGRRLVTNGRSVEFWRIGEWSVDLRIARPALEGFPVPMTFSPDGRMLAVCPSTHSVRLVEPQTGLEYATFELPNPWWIANMSFSPDSSQLALSGAWTQEFCVWDLRRVRERLAALKLDWDLPPFPRLPH